MKFSLEAFKDAVQNGFLKPYSLSYDYVDESKYELIQKQIEWTDNKIADTFQELRQRMGKKYFKNVLLSQICALDYAALQFPFYGFMLTEDLSDDWLAIVDFHKKYARDHSLHQPLTAYVVAQMLGFGDSSKSLAIPATPGNLLDFCVKTILTEKSAHYILESARKYGLSEKLLVDCEIAWEFWKGLFYQTAVLSALFHDIGYPWQYVDRVGLALRKSVTTLHQSDNIVNKIIEDFKDRMVFLPLRNYQLVHDNEPVFEKDYLFKLVSAALETHGFPGGIAFLILNDAIRRSSITSPLAKMHSFAIEWAAMGIFMHDMEGQHTKSFPKLKVSFCQDPMSSLISLADYLEEFNRPKVQFKSKIKESRMKYGFDCSSVDINVDSNGIMHVDMEYRSNTSKVVAVSFKSKETENYFNPSSGYVDLMPLGIKQVVYNQI